MVKVFNGVPSHCVYVCMYLRLGMWNRNQYDSYQYTITSSAQHAFWFIWYPIYKHRIR